MRYTLRLINHSSRCEIMWEMRDENGKLLICGISPKDQKKAIEQLLEDANSGVMWRNSEESFTTYPVPTLHRVR